MNIDFFYDGIVHNIQLDIPKNDKITAGLSLTMQTFHFSVEQIENCNIQLDSGNCFNCPLSFSANNGISGGCYTHEGDMFRGIISKMKRLNRAYIAGNIPQYTTEIHAKILQVASAASFCRFGAYGEAVTMPQNLVESLAEKFGKNRTGYTHLWNKEKYQWASKYFQASTDGNHFLKSIANSMGWREFNMGKTDGSVQCPSDPTISEEKRVPCEKCRLCGGSSVKAKGVYILNHNRKARSERAKLAKV